MSRVVPVRTCVGCRVKAAKPDLLRVVVDVSGPVWSVVPDVHGTKPGRGAHVHPSSACLDLADRRRAFSRAFRLEGRFDVTPVRDWLETNGATSPEDVSHDTSRKRSSGS